MLLQYFIACGVQWPPARITFPSTAERHVKIDDRGEAGQVGLDAAVFQLQLRALAIEQRQKAIHPSEAVSA